MTNDLIVLPGELVGAIVPSDPAMRIRACWRQIDEQGAQNVIFDASLELIENACEGIPMSSVEVMYDGVEELIQDAARGVIRTVHEYTDALGDVDLLPRIRKV